MAADPELDVPPDLVLVAPGGAGDRSLPVHPVINRAPVVLVAEGAFRTPIDEMVINPRDFRRDWAEGVVDLRPVAPGRLVLSTDAGELVLDGARGATERVVRRLRGAQGVRLAWPEDGVADHARVVAGLAMAGVPLVGPAAPGPARQVLGERLACVLETPADLTVAVAPGGAQHPPAPRGPGRALGCGLAPAGGRRGRCPLRRLPVRQHPARHQAPTSAGVRAQADRQATGGRPRARAGRPRLDARPRAGSCGAGRHRRHDPLARAGDHLRRRTQRSGRGSLG